MSIQKLFTSRSNKTTGSTYVGERGHIFYDETGGQLRLSDGHTPGGLPILVASTTANLGNLYVAGSTISTVNPNEDLNLNSNGTGNVNIVGSLRILTSTGYYSTTPVLSASQAGNVTVNGNLITNGTTYFVGPTIHQGSIITNGNLIVNGQSYFVGSVTEVGNLNVSGNANIAGPASYYGLQTTYGATVFNGNVTTNGNINIAGNLYQTGNNIVTGTLLQYGSSTFIVTQQNSTTGAIEITGDTSGNWQTPVNTGVMLHVTGQANNSDRVYIDSLGSYSVLAGRRFEGTMASPTGVQGNVDLFRVAGTPYTTGGWANIGPARIAFTTNEIQTGTNQGGRIEFWTTANASGPAYSTITRTATIDPALGVTATGFVTTGNVTANYFVGNGAALTGLSTYSNANVASYLPTYSGNIAAGNVAITLNETVGGNVIVTGNITAGNVNITNNETVGGTVTVTGNVKVGGNLILSNTAGGVTQSTNKTTAVTANGATGQITMASGTIGAYTINAFTVNNSYVNSNDSIIVNLQTPVTAGTYLVTVGAVAAGSFIIYVYNATGAGHNDALVINFAVIRAVS